MFIHDVCTALDEADVMYAIVGGYAVSLHGAIRGTVDVDVAIQWSLKNLLQAEKALKQMGLVSRIPINAESLFGCRDKYIQERNLIAWNFYDPCNPTKQVDLIVNYDIENIQNTKLVQTALGQVRILSIDSLIKMKEASGRPQDLADVEALKSL
jgi:hypothetical protein